MPKMLKAQSILETLVGGCVQGSFVLKLMRPDRTFRTWWRSQPDGAAMDRETVMGLKARGCRIIAYKGGNGAVISMEAIIAKPPRADAERYFDHDYYDAVWMTPQHLATYRGWCEMIYRRPVREVPQIWSPLLIEALPAPARARFGFRPPAGGWRIGILDPNVTVMKTSHLPMLVCEAAFRRNREHFRIGAAAGDVVDNGGASLQCFARHGGLRGVDGDECGDAPAQLLNHRDYARELLVRRNRVRPGPRRFAAHVYDLGAVSRHSPPLLHRFLRGEEFTAVRKGIRRDVEHAHDHRARGEIECAAVDFPKRLTHPG